jgi:hypothetical protein
MPKCDLCVRAIGVQPVCLSVCALGGSSLLFGVCSGGSGLCQCAGEGGGSPMHYDTHNTLESVALHAAIDTPRTRVCSRLQSNLEQSLQLQCTKSQCPALQHVPIPHKHVAWCLAHTSMWHGTQLTSASARCLVHNTSMWHGAWHTQACGTVLGPHKHVARC